MKHNSYVMQKNITNLYNIHTGRRCFIIGNGPSLSISDLDMLNNEITFAANKVYLAFKETSWRPSYYFVIDRLVAENNTDAILNMDIPKYFPDLFESIFGIGENINYFKVLRGQRLDINEGVDCRSTVIAPMMQFAYYMGIRKIILIGLDFNFKKPKKSIERTLEDDEILISEGEINHFHPDYRAPGEKWSYPKLDLQYDFFDGFYDFTRKQNNTNVIYNASRFTKLDVFPLVDFNSLFNT